MEELLLQLSKDLQNLAMPRTYDWLILAVSSFSIVLSFIIFKRQTKIMEEQNKISLFEKRYEILFILEKIILSEETFRIYPITNREQLETMSSEQKQCFFSTSLKAKYAFFDSVLDFNISEFDDYEGIILYMPKLVFQKYKQYENILRSSEFIYPQSISKDIIKFMDIVFAQYNNIENFEPIDDTILNTIQSFNNTVIPEIKKYLRPQ